MCGGGHAAVYSATKKRALLVLVANLRIPIILRGRVKRRRSEVSGEEAENRREYRVHRREYRVRRKSRGAALLSPPLDAAKPSFFLFHPLHSITHTCTPAMLSKVGPGK